MNGSCNKQGRNMHQCVVEMMPIRYYARYRYRSQKYCVHYMCIFPLNISRTSHMLSGLVQPWQRFALLSVQLYLLKQQLVQLLSKLQNSLIFRSYFMKEKGDKFENQYEDSTGEPCFCSLVGITVCVQSGLMHVHSQIHLLSPQSASHSSWSLLWLTSLVFFTMVIGNNPLEEVVVS